MQTDLVHSLSNHDPQGAGGILFLGDRCRRWLVRLEAATTDSELDAIDDELLAVALDSLLADDRIQLDALLADLAADDHKLAALLADLAGSEPSA